ncbi:MAG: hypothetical protein GC160_21050 [Acidobacteria bacterium]|nr:hypothetical protein [Acidobacteriota bacterium]
MVQSLVVRSLRAVAVVALFATAAVAQVESARIQGTVTDGSGAVIPGATVRFVQVETNQAQVTETDAIGFFQSVPLRIGEYRVEVEADGFKRAVRSGIVLELEQTAAIRVALEVGAVTEVVDVTADAPLLETTQATQGQVINNKRIVDMPLNGRDYIQLALLSAGATRPIGGRFGGFSAGGQRTTQNNYTLDGVDNNNLQIAAQGRRAEVVKPSVDAIQEFKISTNAYSAESGRALGGTVNVSIKSGTNKIHGTLFEFLRNDKVDAKNFFDPVDKPKPPFKRNQFGFSVGGPIIKNKTFAFGDYEGTRIRESSTYNNTIPTQAQIGGDFSGVPQTIYDPATYDAASNTRQPFANNLIPSSRFDPVSVQAATLYPATNRPGITNNYLVNAPSPEDMNRGDVRVDHVFSAKDTVFFRYSRQLEVVGNSPRFPSTLDGNGTLFHHNGDNMGFSWSHILSPSFISTVKLGWNRIYTIRTAVVDENLNAKFGIRGVDQALPGMALMNISGVQNIGLSNYTPNIADSQSRQLKIDNSYTKGKHTLKFGWALQFLQSYLTNPQQSLGNFTFNGNYTRQSAPGGDRGGRPFADFLLGTAFRSNISNSVYMNLRTPWNHFYVQDDWRVTSRLTLNVGLRYEYSPPWVEKNNLISNFDIDTDHANPSFRVASDGDGRISRSLIKNDTNNLAPRFGFAYKAFDKTVVRGGYGVFYSNYEGTGGGQFMETNPPFHIKSQISTDSINPTLQLSNGNPSGILTPENAVSLSFSSFQRQPNWPISQQWNLNMQHSLFRDVVLEVGYYGSKSQFLVNRLDGNYALPGPGDINSRRIYNSTVYPGTNTVVGPLAAMNRHEFNGNSLYHSGQVRLEKRFSKGFTLLGAYIFSRTLGDVSGFSGSGNSPNSGIQNPLNRQAERSLADQHRKHSFTMSYVYELPFGQGRKFGSNMHRALDFAVGGWSVAGIHSIATGRPFGLSVRGNPANNGNLNRPNVVPGVDPVLSSDVRDPQRWFNTDAFVPNNAYEYGNAGRNILIGPGTFTWDFALYKRFNVTESKFFQFRFESFNFTNTPNFGFPNSEVGNNNFGVITSAGRPRNLQFGLKFIF